MSMSKRDFIALADEMRTALNDAVLHQSRDSDVYHCRETVEWLIGRLASFCKSQNPAFKRDRWIAYIHGECGPNGGTIKE